MRLRWGTLSLGSNCLFCLPILMAWLVAPAWAQRGPAVVELAEVEYRTIAASQATLGSIMPSRRAVIGSAVDGRVDEFLVREGDRVEANDPIAQLLIATISLEIDSAEAELTLRREELEELRNGSRPEEIVQAKARVEATRVLAENLEANLKRFTGLGSTSAVSRTEFDNASSAYQEALQRNIEATAAYELAVQGPRVEKIRQAEARVAMQLAIVDKLKDQLGKHTLRTRFAGYVTAELTEVGQWLARGEGAAEIVALDEVEVLAKVLEAHIPFIHVGDPIEVEVPAHPGRKFEGVVEAVIPEADERSRTFPVKIRIANEFNEQGEMLLKAGMLARALLPTEEPKQVPMVPKDALVLGGKSPLMWLVDEASLKEIDGMFEADARAIPITTGTEDDAWIEVRESLQAGARVVIRGNERIPLGGPDAPPSRVTWKKGP